MGVLYVSGFEGMAAVLALVVIEVGTVDLLTDGAADLAPDSASGHNADDTTDHGTKYRASWASDKPHSGAQ